MMVSACGQGKTLGALVVHLCVLRGIDRRLLRPIVTNKRPSLNPDVEAELVRHYRADAKALKEEFDSDVEHCSVFA